MIRPFCRILSLLSVILCFATGALAQDTTAENAEIQDFFGSYEGKTSFLTDSGAFKRDLRVTIQPLGQLGVPDVSGFRLDWTIETLKEGDGEAIAKSFAYNLAQVGEDDLYVPVPHIASNADLDRPNDPREEIQSLWAVIRGQTLSVYALVVTASGEYDMQIYDRTLTAHGLDLNFERFTRGKRTRFIRAALRRIE